MHDAETQEIRLDKWLWAAHFFETRSLAAQAIAGGKVEINDDRARPSRLVRLGDRVKIRRGPYEWTMVVKAISRLRGPAQKAQLLYNESAESVRKREVMIAQMKL